MPDVKSGQAVISLPVIGVHHHSVLAAGLTSGNRGGVIQAASESVVGPQTQTRPKAAIHVHKPAVEVIDAGRKENSGAAQLGITANRGKIREVLCPGRKTRRAWRRRTNDRGRLVGIGAQNLMVPARSDVAHAKADVAGQALLDFKMIIEYSRGIRVRLYSQTATSRRGARQLRNSGHDLQRKGNIRTADLRSSRNGRNIDTAPTDVVQDVVSHAKAAPDAGLPFPKRIPGQRGARPEQPLGSVLCEQRIADPRLCKQHTIRSLREAGGHVVIGMVAVRKLVTQPQAHGEVRSEFNRILYKP